MSLWGKIIGGAAGLAVGGPIGALLGVAVGAVVDEGVERIAPSGDMTRRVTFTIGVIALAAKMAKADGRVTRDEVDAFKRVFRVEPEEMQNVGRVFDMARRSTAGYEEYARQIAGLMQGNRTILFDLVDILFYIAKADGHIHPAELEFIRRVSDIFGFSAGERADVEARHCGPDQDSPYTVLGVSPNVSDEALREVYRNLVRENHPDRLMAEGVPPELLAVATRRSAEINAAYDAIKAQRQKKPTS